MEIWLHFYDTGTLILRQLVFQVEINDAIIYSKCVSYKTERFPRSLDLQT